MNRFLWVLQILFGLYFIYFGVRAHLLLPEGLPAQLSWMYELPRAFHVTIGTLEILAGLGLILPGLTRIRPELTAFAAAGLVVVMIGAIIWHAGREETTQAIQDVIFAAFLGFVAYGRWRISPLHAR